MAVADVRLRALERPWRGRAGDPAGGVDYVVMAVGSDPVFFRRIAGLKDTRRIGDRETFRGAITQRVRTRRGETRAGVRLSDAPAIRERRAADDGCRKPCQCRAAGNRACRNFAHPGAAFTF